MKIKYILAIFFLIALCFSSCKLNVEADKKENSDTVNTEDGNKIISVTGISFTNKELEIGIDQSKKLDYILTPSNASNKKVKFEIVSGGENISLTENSVTGLKQGPASVKIITDDGSHTDTCAITVLAKPVSMEVPFSELVDYLENTASKTEVNYITVTGLTDANLASSWIDSNDTLGAILRQDITKKIALKLDGSFSQLGAQAFKSCKNLVSIKIPTNITKIDSATFLGCEGLTSINIPANVKTVGVNSFFQCYGLTEVNIAEGVEGIGQYAFDDCKKAKITLPKTIQVIGTTAFGEKTEGNIIVAGKDSRVLKVLVPNQTEAQAPATKTVKQMVIDTLPSPGFPEDRIEEYN